MDKQYLPTTENPTILVEVAGNLRLKGHDELQVVAKSGDEEFTLEERDGQIWVSSSSDCAVRVPRQAIVHLKVVHGDAYLKGLDGPLTGDAVHGQLVLRDVGETSITTVSGDATAKNIAGSLTFDRVYGNLQVRDVQGMFTVTGSVSGNLRLDGVDEGASAKVDGNVTLRLDPGPGEKFEFTAVGNIFCHLPEDASVELSVPHASQVMVNLAGTRPSAPINTPYSLSLGDADSSLTLSAEGNVVLDQRAVDWDELGHIRVEFGEEMESMADAIGTQIEAQLEAQMSMVEQQLEAQMASLEMRLNTFGMSEEQVRRAQERARAASERAQAHAQERMRHAQERLERKLAETQQRLQRKAYKAERAAEHGVRRGRPPVQFTIPPAPPRPPRPPMPPAPVSEPVSEQERLIILQMLEQNKISLEQAEKLLMALEGKDMGD